MQDAYLVHPIYSILQGIYNWSCSPVGHDLIDHVKSSPEQISTFYVPMEVFHALAKMHRCSEHGLSDCVLPDCSLGCIPCNTFHGYISFPIENDVH